MNVANHPAAHDLVQRLVVELQTRRPRSPDRIEAEVELLLAEEVWPAMEAICSRLCPEGKTVRIDRMVIDLGHVPRAQVRSRWSSEVCRRFEEGLREALNSARGVTDAPAAVLPRERPGVAVSGPERGSTEASDLSTLRFFLTHGLRPWWWNRSPGDMRALLAGLLERAPSALRRVLRVVLADAAACRRFSAQFSSDAVREVLLLLVARDRGAASRELVRAVPSFGPSAAKPGRRIEAEARLLAQAASLARDQGASETFLPGTPVGPAAAREPERTRPTGDTDATTTGGQPPETEVRGTDTPSDADLTTKGAGLVLLWPFLGRFFGHLGLLGEGDFRDLEARLRALHLLHFLVHDEEGAAEHELTLPKLLCAVPLPQPVPWSVELTAAERSECEQLIDAVIANWPPMKNTSRAGFRRSFLQREGRLSLPEDATPMLGWKLEVERKGYDVLLDRLPWSLFVVKLRWMPRPIFVEW